MNPRRVATPLCLLLLAGCAAQGPRPVFTDGPVVVRVADDVPIPVPAETEFYRLSHHIENFALRQSRLRLDPRTPEPALDVNRFGDVIESSWWRRRIDDSGVASGTVGPGGDDPGPEAFLPWEITGLKVGGRNPGFNIRDARGVGYIVKFDKAGAPAIASGAGAVAARLLWALGYNVPDDRVVFFTRDDLRVAAGASVKNSLGEKRPLTEADIDVLLAHLPQALHQGRFRALVSRFIDGIPLGGFAYTGTRADDPNDVIPHERRRSLRALRVFGAWLQHVDQKLDNTLDMSGGEPGHGHLVHYLVDFDGCLGGYWAARHEQRIGYAYDIDLKEILVGIPALGLRVRPYEDLPAPTHPEVGLYTADGYDAGGWQPNYANDYLSACGPADAFWAGLELAKVTDEMIDAAAAAARFDDPAATAVLADALKARRDATLEWALTQVSPVWYLDPRHPFIDLHGGPEFKFEPSYPGEIDPERFDKWSAASGKTWRIELINDTGDVYRTIAERSASFSIDIDAPSRAPLRIRWTATDREGRELPPTEAHYVSTDSGWVLRGVLRAGQ